MGLTTTASSSPAGHAPDFGSYRSDFPGSPFASPVFSHAEGWGRGRRGKGFPPVPDRSPKPFCEEARSPPAFRRPCSLRRKGRSAGIAPPYALPAGGGQDEGDRPRPLNTHRRSPPLLPTEASVPREEGGTPGRGKANKPTVRRQEPENSEREIQVCQNAGRVPGNPTKTSGILLPSPTTSLGGVGLGVRRGWGWSIGTVSPGRVGREGRVERGVRGVWEPGRGTLRIRGPLELGSR